MEHLILTETEFFRLIDNPGSRTGLNAAYNEFTMAVVSLCTGAASPCHPLPALSYAETELQYHKALQATDTDHGVFVRKALAFVRKMLKHLALPYSQVPPLSSIPSKDEKRNDTPADAPPMRWTGKASDLVELIYGVSEMGCINGGEASLKEIAAPTSWNLSMASARWAASTVERLRSRRLPPTSTRCSGCRQKAATTSTMTSRCARTRAAPISSTARRRR